MKLKSQSELKTVLQIWENNSLSEFKY